MERTEILERVQNIFRRVFDDENLTINDNSIISYRTMVNDIGDCDSFEHINLIVEMESEFGIKFPMKKAMAIKNIGEMIDLIFELIQ